jgi:HPt (histidine-containing phosphotransfer) domain-containing protein
MNDFVTKPVNPEELISVLCHWIDKIQVVDKNQEIDNKPLPAVAGPTVLPAENSRKPKPSISLPGFDLLNLSSMVGGDEKIIHELLCIFREDLAPTLNDIEAKITEGNLHAAGNLAHRIKGTAGNLGAKALQAIAAKMEATLKQGIWQPEVCIEFKRIVLETLEALNSLGKI